MPTYEYECRKCGHTFEQVMPIRDHERQKEKKPACPKCRSVNVVQRISGFQVVTSKKA